MVDADELNRNVKVSPEVMFQELGGEMVPLDLASERYFGLDEVGARIWVLLKEHGALQTVFEAMLVEYDVGTERTGERFTGARGAAAGGGAGQGGVMADRFHPPLSRGAMGRSA